MVLVGIQMGPNAGLLASVYYFCSMTLQGKVTDSGLMNRSLAHSYSKEERGVLNNLLNFSQLVIKAFMSFLFKWQLFFCFFFLLGNKNRILWHSAWCFQGKEEFSNCGKRPKVVSNQWLWMRQVYPYAVNTCCKTLQPRRWHTNLTTPTHVRQHSVKLHRTLKKPFSLPPSGPWTSEVNTS